MPEAMSMVKFSSHVFRVFMITIDYNNNNNNNNKRKEK